MTAHTILLRQTLAIAGRAMQKGNLPFGCLLAAPDGSILEEGENTVVTENNAIAHCEINLLQQLAGKYSPDYLQQCTVYASTEPCPMCTAGIFWAGIGRLLFALSKEQYHHISGTVNPAHLMEMSAAELLLRGGRKVTVLGPLLEEEALIFYKSCL
jgi:tRNA(adenine34) deaminase